MSDPVPFPTAARKTAERRRTALALDEARGREALAACLADITDMTVAEIERALSFAGRAPSPAPTPTPTGQEDYVASRIAAFPAIHDKGDDQ